ncbi:MAG: methyltransferase domain-containing protein [Gammaproteobacteria bacterium]|nr:methyltransferase domain-containing protein [Rhodocyclaceae bacterium]MBU3909269.1 methyltransferase domain-containing protein [Gammaproteobacteria bacterium]MBU3989537.1 methyltransferase domain-containing protein [Gammaproteobacteria bacterium]MBU4005571.1 methyltransferase domain-containing protein [Gammaproteobacteria bacterium]MBU4020876.1 methyltransferase domain-containing protein [Gammaproteobacteria bacterium]
MSFDPRQMKRIERDGYNLIGARYAAGAAARTALTDALIEAAHLQPNQNVLDLAAGPGLLASAAREKVGAGGTAIATDLAEAQLACCPGLPRVAADGEYLPFVSNHFDRVLCGLGLMVFPDTARALADARRVMAPGGMIALSVWGEAEHTPLLACALDCMKRLLPAPKVARPSVFRFGTTAALGAPLAEAGFGEIAIETIMIDSYFADAASYWQAFLDLAGGAAGSLARQPESMQQRLATEVAQELSVFAGADGYAMQSAVLIATATRK